MKPIKIFLTVRNRLAITKKCIESIERNTRRPYILHVWNNATSHKLEEHQEYFNRMYAEGRVHQITWTHKESTFNAFSKAVACNVFGAQHVFDPQKNEYDFIMMLDNDMILIPGWDNVISDAWQDIKDHNEQGRIKLVGQRWNGIMNRRDYGRKVAGLQADLGNLGGSGFWCVQPNWFEDVGFLDLKPLVGLNKKHDQSYWPRMARAAKNPLYAISLNTKLVYHCGGVAGSTCNSLSFNRPKDAKDEELIRFEKEEQFIDGFTYEEFVEYVKTKPELLEY